MNIEEAAVSAYVGLADALDELNRQSPKSEPTIQHVESCMSQLKDALPEDIWDDVSLSWIAYKDYKPLPASQGGEK